MDKNEKEKSEAMKIKILMSFVIEMDLEYLKECAEGIKNNYNTYQAIGILDSENYYDKCDDAEQRIKRLNSIINFIETLKSTQIEMDKIKERKTYNGEAMNKIKNLLG